MMPTTRYQRLHLRVQVYEADLRASRARTNRADEQHKEIAKEIEVREQRACGALSLESGRHMHARSLCTCKYLPTTYVQT